MKRFLILTTLTLLLGAMIAPEAAQAAKPATETKAKSNTGQLRKIKLRMQRNFLPGKPSDAQVEELLKELESDGSFSSIDYENTEFNSGGKKTPHLTKVTSLAKAYATNPGTYYKNREVYDAIARALKYWVDRNLEDKNWWHRIIGFPKAMMTPLMLVGDDMKRYDKELFKKCVEYELYSWSIPKQRAQDGANGTDICKFTFATAVLTEDEALLNEVMEKVNGLIKIAQEDLEEGIQPDYSFSQHNGSGRQLYLATYGREYVDGIVYFMEYVSGTDFWLSPEKVDIFERLFLDNLYWTWYGGEIDVNQYGRGLLRNSTAQSYLELTQRLAALGTPKAEELKKMATVMKGSGELNGNRVFPRADYMIHRPQGAMISTRMTSIRTVGNEAGNSEGMDNYHTGDGANYIKVHGDEYNGVYAGWNWKRIPGTTVMADNRKMPAPMWGKDGGGGSDYASGASDGKNGVCAFIYSKDSLEAHKGWFYFDRYFVALGSGIKSARTDAPAVTTVNQTQLAGKVALSNAGAASELAGAKTTAPFDRLWNYDTGYRFENGTTPLAENYKGTYDAAYKGKKVDILWIGIDHGKAPQGGTYAYAVYPNMGRDEFLKREADYRILSNTPQLQAVQDIASGKTMAAFYEPGSFSAEGIGTVSADKPCLLIVAKADGKTTVSVANPFCESRPMDAVTVQAGDKQASVAFKDGGNTVEL